MHVHAASNMPMRIVDSKPLISAHLDTADLKCHTHC